jgi:predicted  nucleic acid-binding Zn-ribbon protein
MADISEVVTKKRKELSSSWEVYFRKLEGARKSVDNMEKSAHEYRQKVYNTISEIKNEGEKLKSLVNPGFPLM